MDDLCASQANVLSSLCPYIASSLVWRAKKGRLYIVDLLEKAAACSKAAMKVQE